MGTGWRSLWSGAILIAMAGCTSISIEPSCPEELRVGDSGTVRANEENPGAIAVYRWQALPPEAGRFANPAAATTEFQALREGEVVLRLTASDGLYQVISQCTTRVTGVAGVAAILNAEPAAPEVGETVRLTCDSIGQSQAVVRTIVQVDGEIVDLSEVSEGVVRFSAEQADDLTFQCTGENAEGMASEPTLLTVRVGSITDNANGNGNLNVNGNTNGNQNQNTNDNATDNGNRNVNDNTGNGNANDNGADNTNTNANQNANDNRRPPGRP